MSRPLIVVCDDDAVRVEDWAEQIRDIDEVKSQYDVRPLTPAQFGDAFAALKARKAEEAQGRSSSRDDAAAIIDSTAVLILDYDLTPRRGDDESSQASEQLEGQFGDTFAFLARCYSSAGYIVLVNEGVQASTFDLTMTMFMESIADLNVAAPDLARRELWTGPVATRDASSQNSGLALSGGDLRFRPWHWPAIVDAPGRLTNLSEAFELEDGVLSFLGLDEQDLLDAFADEQLDVFSLRADDDVEPRQVTFRQLATGSVLGLPGLSDKQSDEGVLRRIAASGTLRWLERMIVPAQNVLIDAPHLIERFPQLLPADDAELNSWEATTSLDRSTDMASRLGPVAEARHEQLSAWLSRPVWRAPAASRIARAMPRTSASNSRVFCEDVSSFRPLNQAREYTSALPGPYRQRFVAYLDAGDIDYRPRRRLLV